MYILIINQLLIVILCKKPVAKATGSISIRIMMNHFYAMFTKH